MSMLWFNFILWVNFTSLCPKLIVIHYYTPKQREITFKPGIKLNCNINVQPAGQFTGDLITW